MASTIPKRFQMRICPNNPDITTSVKLLPHLRRRLSVFSTLVAVTAVAMGFSFLMLGRPARAVEPHGEIVTFAGGCFWGLEAAFRQLKGVTGTEVGYAATSNLEACRVTFDPSQITYKQLAEYFLAIHKLAAAPHNAPYLGSPGRLVIYYNDDAQQKTAEALKSGLPSTTEGRHSPSVEVLPACQFSRAEEDQQHYLEKHGRASCRISL